MNIFGSKPQSNFISSWIDHFTGSRASSFPTSIAECKDLLWDHKYLILGSAAAIFIAQRLIKYCKNRPLRVNAEIASTLSKGVLKVKTPNVPFPLKGSITVCFDRSTSMGWGISFDNSAEKKSDSDEETDEETRLQAVEDALKRDVLDDAQNRINKSKNSKFEFAVVGFDHNCEILLEPTQLVPDGSKTSERAMTASVIKEKLFPLKAQGGTEITHGLTAAATLFKDMATRIKEGIHIFLVLSDGDEEKPYDQTQLRSIDAFKDDLAKYKAKLFVVGIGKTHNKDALGQIASLRNGFSGTYIDTTDGQTSIQKAIAEAYEAAIPCFNLKLASPQLKPGTWSAGGGLSTQEGRQSIVSLGRFPQNRQFLKVLEIHRKKFDQPFELGKLKFDLLVEDPYGRKGKITLSWNANTVIHPDILNGRWPQPKLVKSSQEERLPSSVSTSLIARP